MVGYHTSGVVFILHVLVMVVFANVGSSFGLLIGIIAKDTATATMLVPMILIPFMIFSGFLISNSNAPVYLIWMNYISPMRWSFQALMKNVFNDFTFTCSVEKQIGGRCFPFQTVILKID
jgi:ABC-type multidrug transport system permease subunit